MYAVVELTAASCLQNTDNSQPAFVCRLEKKQIMFIWFA